MSAWGKVIDGAGNSSNWMPDYLPRLYPGTLNLWMDEVPPLLEWHTTIETHFGPPVRLANVRVNGFQVYAVECPLAERNTQSLEVASFIRLRDFLKLETGDRVNVIY
jgi:CTP-dependent riboflavin kinase